MLMKMVGDILQQARQVHERQMKLQEEIGDLAFTSICEVWRIDDTRETAGHSMLDARQDHGNLRIRWP
jgi:hypothetical protein